MYCPTDHGVVLQVQLDVPCSCSPAATSHGRGTSYRSYVSNQPDAATRALHDNCLHVHHPNIGNIPPAAPDLFSECIFDECSTRGPYVYTTHAFSFQKVIPLNASPQHPLTCSSKAYHTRAAQGHQKGVTHVCTGYHQHVLSTFHLQPRRLPSMQSLVCMKPCNPTHCCLTVITTDIVVEQPHRPAVQDCSCVF